jgi:hypothetical protein
MKRLKFRCTFIMLLLASVTACTEKVVKDSSSQTSNPITTTGGTTGGSTAGTTTGTTTGGSTTGTTTGGTTGGTPANVFKFNVLLSGRPYVAQSPYWYPGFYPSDYSSSTHGGDFLQISSGNINVFKSDFRFKARVKVLSEPPITGGVQTCFLRTSGSNNSTTFPYTKLRLEVAIRDILFNAGTNTYSIGSRYASKNLDSVSVNSYSSVLDWSKNQFPTRSPATGNDNVSAGALMSGIVGHVVEVHNVMSDTEHVQNGGTTVFKYHPNTRCWKLELELATDLTQDF